MRRPVTWMAMAGLLAGLAGCYHANVPLGPNPDDDLSLRLRSRKDVYYEYEPLQLLLFVQNSGEDRKRLPFAGQDAVISAQRPIDDVTKHYSFRVALADAAAVVPPGDLRMFELTNRDAAACLREAGTWRLGVKIRSAGGKNDLFTGVDELVLTCVRQPLALPAGTPRAVQAAMEDLAKAPIPPVIQNLPAMTRMGYSPQMLKLKRLGDAAVPAMVANLNHYRLQPMLVQVLGDLRARSAVPRLIQCLHMDTSASDYLIVAALTNITGIAEGYEYHRAWDDPDLRQKVVRMLQEWAARNP